MNTKEKTPFKKLILYYLLMIVGVVGLVAIDRVTKYLAVLNLKDNEPFVLIDNVLELHYLENTGAAFGMLKGAKIFFVILTVVFLVVAVIAFGKIAFTKKNMPLHVLIVFLLSGAVGNFIDRIRFDYVVDFIYFKLINFPIFNVADIYVSLSVVVLIVLLIFFYKDEPKDKNKEMKVKDSDIIEEYVIHKDGSKEDVTIDYIDNEQDSNEE